jgi:hypothetical protein
MHAVFDYETVPGMAAFFAASLNYQNTGHLIPFSGGLTPPWKPFSS